MCVESPLIPFSVTVVELVVVIDGKEGGRERDRLRVCVRISEFVCLFVWESICACVRLRAIFHECGRTRGRERM